MRLATLPLMAALASTSLAAQQLEIYHIDVDQGDATLVVSPTGESLLIDSGDNGQGRRIRQVLQNAGVERIDHFVTTHYHADHYGGIDELTVSPAIPIINVYDRGDKAFLPISKSTGARYVEYDTAVGHRAQHLQRGEAFMLGAVTVTCIASGGVVMGEQNPEPGRDENDMSVALLIEWQGFRLFVGGDIESFTEEKIAALDAVTDVDVYQANHHGSHSSTSAAFILDLSPSVVIISNGDRADYRHPRQVTLEALASLPEPPAVFQTNRYTKGGLGGNVADDFIADQDPSGPEGTIRVTVDASGGQYSIRYGTNQHTFAIKNRTPPETSIVIESLLPNPVGPDRELEEVTVRNEGPGTVDLKEWYLRDLALRRWPLADLGTLAAGSSGTTLRRGLPLNLNNGGDTIVLVDPTGQVRDRFGYTTTAEGIRIVTGN